VIMPGVLLCQLSSERIYTWQGGKALTCHKRGIENNTTEAHVIEVEYICKFLVAFRSGRSEARVG